MYWIATRLNVIFKCDEIAIKEKPSQGNTHRHREHILIQSRFQMIQQFSENTKYEQVICCYAMEGRKIHQIIHVPSSNTDN